MAGLGPPFEAKTCREAVNAGLQFIAATDDYQPIPASIRTLLHVLTVAEFVGRPNTEENRVRLTDCFLNAVRPWRVR